MDEDRAKHEQPEPPPGGAPSVGVPEQADHGIKQKSADDEQEGSANHGRWTDLKTFLKGSDTPNWVMVFLTVVISFGTIGQCIAVRESNENAVDANAQILDEMRDSNRLTSETLGESRRQFDLTRADAIAEGGKTEQRFRDTMKASREESAASLGVAQRQLEQAGRSLEISEGAELVVVGIEFVGDLRSDPNRVRLAIKNTGGSAAERVAVSMRRTDRDALTAEDIGISDDPDVNPLPPEGTQYARFRFTAIPEKAVQVIESGGIRLRYLGNVSYGDKLREWPPVPFCYIWHAAEKHFDRCFESQAD